MGANLYVPNSFEPKWRLLIDNMCLYGNDLIPYIDAVVWDA